jgi:hypothetical protein
MDGFAAYERNTGMSHPFAEDIKRSTDPAIGSVPLVTNESEEYWFGTIDIGTPGKPFTGMAFLASSPSRFLTLALIQSFSILAAAMSSYPRFTVE